MSDLLLLREEYGDFVLHVRYNYREVLIGYISPRLPMPVPHGIIHGLHGTGTMSASHQEKEIIGMTESVWTARVCCSMPGDKNVVNGQVGYFIPGWQTREWTVKSVFDHLKECIDG